MVFIVLLMCGTDKCAAKIEVYKMMNQVIEHYDLLAEEGNDPVHDSPFLKEYMDKWDGQEFIEKLELEKTKTVLEIGIGTGRLAVRTVPLCGCFFGIDISAKTIELAKKNLAEWDNAVLLCGDFLTYTFPQTFDVIYSSLTFMHIEAKQIALNKVADLLKDGGRFVLSIDKNQEGFIDIKSRKVPVFPDNPDGMVSKIKMAGLKIMEQFETEFAHVFVTDLSLDRVPM